MPLKMTHVLFVCSQNRLRSPTAEQVFSTVPELQLASAGLDARADTPVPLELLGGPDIACVTERSHRNKLSKRSYPGTSRPPPNPLRSGGVSRCIHALPRSELRVAARSYEHAC
jgi:hypothetical protein